ncbi:hypothetical protein [Mycobacterium sp. NS-7484]|uniref:Rv1733c family protein n=1 Tax=Mycobacterium sp. NS-7484 TaxID=1834161 RepID=UPI00114DD0F2|nr:hypothetical protein [Mycobacterium sp. NS-7484]
MSASTSMRRPWILRALGGGALVRRHDRIEAVVTLLSVIALIVAVPAAVLVSRAAYADNVARNLEYAKSVHSVEATVTEVAVNAPARLPHAPRRVGVRWTSAFQEQTGFVSTAEPVQVGARITVWLDNTGAVTRAPRSDAELQGSALSAGLALWTGTALVGLATIAVLRVALNRRRDAAWDEQWYQFCTSDGRANRDH